MVTISIATRVLAICQRLKIGIYLADIFAAFDRVCRTRLLAKLCQIGVPDSFIDFLNSYLLPREGYVAVEGCFSDIIVLMDMVFQGTVLGPTLWNSYFGDIASFVEEGKQKAQIFADDLNVVSRFPIHMSAALVKADLGEAQRRAHE